jgi:uncharacterized protein with NRDE domain
MCIIYLSIAKDPDWPLYIAANRDEFHARPALPAAPWDANPDIFSGLDLSGGGTWLAINRNGRFAMLTNFRDPSGFIPQAPTRGLLVSNFVDGDTTAGEYAAQVWKTGDNYNGFNLIVGDVSEVYYTGNRQDAPPQKLAHGSYILSNHLLDTPWPKAERLRRGLDALTPDCCPDALQQVFALLKDTTPAPDDALPDTGIPLDRERLLSSPFIISENYGTRCSSIIAVNRSGQATFSELTYAPDASETGRRDWTFSMHTPYRY